MDEPGPSTGTLNGFTTPTKSGNSARKRRRKEETDDSNASDVSDVQLKRPRTLAIKKKRRRPKTRGLREELRTEIEKALRAVPSPIGHLFKEVDDDGLPIAPLQMVWPSLGVADWKVQRLNEHGLLTLGRFSEFFDVIKSGDDVLLIRFCHHKSSIEQCTVYLDNLPVDVTLTRVRRLAAKYGDVVDIRLPRYQTKLKPFLGVPRGFAFIQFTYPDAADDMVKAFAYNAPPRLAHRLRNHFRRISRGLKVRRRSRWRGGREQRYRSIKVLHCIKRRLRRRRMMRSGEKKPRRKSTSAPARRKTLPEAELKKVLEEAKAEMKKVKAEDKKRERQATPTTPISERKKRRILVAAKRRTLALLNAGGASRRHKKRKKKKNPDLRVTLTKYFDKIQVFSFEKYKEMRSEYTTLRAVAEKDLNSKLREAGIRRNGLNNSEASFLLKDKTWSVADGQNES